MRGKPKKLGDLDQKVQKYMCKLCSAGTPVNRSIVIAATRGVVQHHSPSLLPEHGGNLELGRKWAESTMTRMGLVRCKATKAARKKPAEFESLKVHFHQRITKVVKDHSVPPALILNFDQTATKRKPTSEWTMAAEGSTQVSVVGIEDKREITVLLCCSLSGNPLVKYLSAILKSHFQKGGTYGTHLIIGVMNRPCYTMWTMY